MSAWNDFLNVLKSIFKCKGSDLKHLESYLKKTVLSNFLVYLGLLLLNRLDRKINIYEVMNTFLSFFFFEDFQLKNITIRDVCFQFGLV